MNIRLLLCSLVIALSSYCVSFGQCTFTGSCTNAWFTSISAAGSGVSSTVTGGTSSCTGVYTNSFSSYGVTAPTGSTVTFTIDKYYNSSRPYSSDLRIYVDWGNDGTFDATDLVGTPIVGWTGSASANYSFTIPLRGIVTNTNLHLRVCHAETSWSYTWPCYAYYGCAYDFYLNATCSVPTISTSISSATICGSGTIPVTASSSLSGTLYEWTPATALSATTGSSITASPTASTTYTVTGYGPGVCEATTTLPITYIAFGPTPTISASGPTTFCAGGSVTLSETSGAALSYQWYTGAAAVIGATNSSFTVSPTTTTTYRVVITTSGGCTSSTTQTVTINPTPSASISLTGPGTVCFPNTIRLNAAPTGGGYSYSWYNSGTATGGTGSSYTASATGSYSVIVTSGSGCSDTSAATSVTVNAKPTAAATSTSPLTVCDYDSVVLTGSAGFASYQWLDGTTPIAGATNRVYVSRIPGTYNYRLQVANTSGCRDTTGNGLFRVTVVASPSSVITHSTPLTFCTGGYVVLGVASGNTYQWYYGTTATALSPISGATAAAYTAATTGYYAVRATNSNGCSTNSIATPTLVTSVPAPYIINPSPSTFCWGSSITLAVNISGAATGVIYQWKLNGTNIPGANGNTYNAYASGDYSCFVNISGSCVSTTPPVTIVNNPLPNPVVSYANGKVSTANYFTNYQWYKGNTLIPGANTWWTAIRDTGSYKVKVIDTNGCQSVSPALPVVKLAVGNVYGHMDISIYPNPATNTITIDAPVTVTAHITTADGKLVVAATTEREININNLAQGLYIITLTDQDGNRVYTGKLVKQ